MTQVIVVVDLIDDYRFEHDAVIPFTLSRITGGSIFSRLLFKDNSAFISSARSQRVSRLFITTFPIPSGQFDFFLNMSSSNITLLPSRGLRLKIGNFSLIFISSSGLTTTVNNIELFYNPSTRDVQGEVSVTIN